MQRRELLRGMVAGALGMCVEPAVRAARGAELSTPVKTVYVVHKCHLDMGFTDTERAVVSAYFDKFLPAAMDVAQSLRSSGSEERYVWTNHAWIIYEYLEQATPEQRKRMEKAILAGDIAYDAMPFTFQAEMLDRSLFAASLRLSADLDRRFGKKTIAGKLSDVPGFTRGIVGPLAQAGVRWIRRYGTRSGWASDRLGIANAPARPRSCRLHHVAQANDHGVSASRVRAGHLHHLSVL